MSLAEIPHSIKCYKAIESYCGGREAIAMKLDVTIQAINAWIARRSIPPTYILELVQLSDKRFTPTDLLTKEKHHDEGTIQA
jgi:hypothetical protein